MAPHNGRGFGSFVTFAAAIVGTRGRGREGFSPAVTLRGAPPFVGTIVYASLWIEALAASWCPRLPSLSNRPRRLRPLTRPQPLFAAIGYANHLTSWPGAFQIEPSSVRLPSFRLTI